MTVGDDCAANSYQVANRRSVRRALKCPNPVIPMMSLIGTLGEHLPLAVSLGSMVAVVALGFWFDARTDAERRRRGLPGWLRAVATGVPFATLFVVLFTESVSVPVVGEAAGGFVLFVLLWLGLPYVASQFVDWEARAAETSEQC